MPENALARRIGARLAILEACQTATEVVPYALMKRILSGLVLIAAAVFFFTGCLGADTARFMKQLGNDPATVHLRVSSIYGVIELTRTAPRTNSMPHSMSPDGTVSVGAPSKP